VVLCHHDRRLELADYWQHPGPVLFRRERLEHVAQTDGLVDEGLSLKAERALGREVFPEPLLAHPRARFTFLVKFSPRLQPVEPNPVVADKEPPGACLPAEPGRSTARRSSSPGPSWKAVGTGDFNDDGRSDILLQNTAVRSRSGR
jgi:hypothetical protein